MGAADPRKGDHHGGPGAAFTALWYPAVAASPAAVAGAILLLIALRRERQLWRTALFWAGVTVIGVSVTLGLPPLTGMAYDDNVLAGPARTAFFATSSVVIVAYLTGLVALAVIGIRHLREHERRRAG